MSISFSSAPVTFEVSAKEAIVVGPGSLESSVVKGRGKYGAAIDGIEALLLALASEGVDISDPRFHSAVETAIESVAENLG